MNASHDCPNCGGAVAFQSSIAVFAVCPYCRSMVVRHDVNVEAIGQMASLPPDLSPLQVGSQGEFDGQPFTLLGRVRLAYDEGSWTEWFAQFGDGRHAGDSSTLLRYESSLNPGQLLEIEKQPYRVTDRKQTVCLGSEGELPFPAPTGRQALSIDLTGAGGRFACAEYSEGSTRYFVGRSQRRPGFSIFNCGHFMPHDTPLILPYGNGMFYCSWTAP